VSVRGEFLRIVGDAIARLRELDSQAADSLAADLEQARRSASEDLSGAAARVLELWEAAPAALAGGAGPADRLGDAAERARAVSRVILGR
jgi:hypothetical protein